MFKRSPRIIWILIFFGIACRGRSPSGGAGSELAEVRVKSLSDGGYDQVRLALHKPDDPVRPFAFRDFPQKAEYLDLTVAPGTYGISLIFYQNKVPVFSSAQCGNPPHFELRAGTNQLTIYICDASGESVGPKKDLAECAGETSVPGVRQLRLLTHNQYQNTVKDLTGFDQILTFDFPKEVKSHGILSRSDLTVLTEAHSEAYFNAADKVAAYIVGRLGQFSSCAEKLQGPQNADTTGLKCVGEFIKDFGKKAFRSPLNESEQKALADLYRLGVSSPGPNVSPVKEGFNRVVVGLLTHPKFLYRWEIGAPQGDRFELSPWEIAQHLSYTLWSTMPDETLRRLAESGKLKDKAVIKQEVGRMLADPRASAASEQFLRQWLGIESVLSVNKDAKHSIFNESMRSNLYKETVDFFKYMTFSKQATLRDLLSAEFTMNSGPNNQIYQGQQDSQFIKLNSRERVGLLGHGSLLAAYADADESSPIKRGVFVLEKLLCRDIPPPPPALMVKPPPRDPNATTRERFEMHSKDPQCSICHKQIDGIGFGLEDMDEIGRYRTFQQKKIVATGTVYNLDGVDRAFTGTAELSNILSMSQDARRCFVIQYQRYVTGLLETQRQKCSVERLTQSLSKEDLSLKSVIAAMVQDISFLQRK